MIYQGSINLFGTPHSAFRSLRTSVSPYFVKGSRGQVRYFVYRINPGTHEPSNPRTLILNSGGLLRRDLINSLKKEAP